MRILVLGGDGYLGWPTAMHLSFHGHDVTVVDNYLRRRLFLEENLKPLFNVPDLNDRADIWYARTHRHIKVIIGDLTQWEFVRDVFEQNPLDAVVHFAEQPSAPYSMMNRQAAMLTIENNICVTANVIHAVHSFCPKAQIVKLGTMGEYGTPNIDIEEGWLDITHNGRKDRFIYPRQAGSLYHTTKIMDTDLLWFYVRTWQLAVTDLMQGPVYGIFTEESGNDDHLLSFFNYDEIFGTVLNRFVVQAVAGYPLTVFGEGGQTRGFINIIDTLNCVRISIESPAKPGELRIFNQMTETFNIRQLAEKVQCVGNRLGLNVHIQSVGNPRKELESHYYNPRHTGLLKLGLQPHYLTDEDLIRLMTFVMAHEHNIKKEQIFRKISWI